MAVSVAERWPCWRTGAPGCSPARGRPRGRLPAPGQGVQVLLRRRDHGPPAAGPRAPAAHRGRGRRTAGGSRPCARSPPRPGGARVPDRHRLGLPGRTGRAARPARGEAGRAVRRGRAVTTWSSTRPTCGSPSTSRSATRPNSTGRSAMRPLTPGRHSPPWTSSARCSTARRSCTSPVTGPRNTAWPPSATTTRGSPASPGT